MRVALLTFDYPPETGYHDVGLQTYYHARALARLGHDVHVFAGSLSEGQKTVWDGPIAVTRRHRPGPWQRLGEELNQLGLTETGLRIAHGADTLTALRRTMRHSRFDLIEVHATGGEAPLLAFRSELPVVVRVLSPRIAPQAPSSMDRMIARATAALGIEAATAISGSSQWVLDQVASEVSLQQPSIVIPNGIDLTLLDGDSNVDVEERFGVRPGRLNILCSDDLHHPEQRALIRTLAQELLEDFDDTAIVLTGQGSTGKFVAELRDELEAGAAVRLQHAVPASRAEHRSLTRAAGIALFTSTRDSCPMAALEAMGAGATILAPAKGGFPELVRAGVDGLLVAPQARDFLEGARSLIRSRDRRETMRKSARERVETDYTDEAIAQRHVDFYAFATGSTAVRLTSSRDPARLFGPHDWFNVWWLKRSPREMPALALDDSGKPLFAALSLDELRFVDSIMSRVWSEEHKDWQSQEWKFLQELHDLYLNRAAADKETGSNADSEGPLRIMLPSLRHPVFEESRARGFVDEMWRIERRPNFSRWLLREIQTPWVAEEARHRIHLRRLALAAVRVEPCPETYAVLRAIYRDPATAEAVRAQDIEFIENDRKGPEHARQILELGLHAPVERPRVFASLPAQPHERTEQSGPAKVTVLIPSYKHQQFIGDTIKSVLAQTYTDIDIVIADDRSPDETVAIAERFDDPRVSVSVNPENLGLGGSIRRALAEIESPYVALLNSDDLFHPERIAKCVELLDAEPEAALVATGMKFIDRDSREITQDTSCVLDVGPRAHSWLGWYESIARELESDDDWVGLGLLLRHNHLATSSNMVMRREFLEEHIEASAKLKYCVDWMLFLIGAMREELRYIPEPLLAYRFHESNTVWFEEGGHADYVLEVNGVVSQVLRLFWSRAITEKEPDVAREELSALIRDHAARHGETEGFTLYLSELTRRLKDRGDSGDGTELDAFIKAALERKTSAMVMERIDLPPWNLVTLAQQLGRHRMDAHVAEAFLSRARQQDAEIDRLSRSIRDQVVRQDNYEKERTAELERLRQEVSGATRERERLEREWQEMRRDRDSSHNENSILQQTHARLISEAQRLRNALDAERDRTREAIDSLSEEQRAHEEDMVQLTKRMHALRDEHRHRIERVTHTHEWKVGRLLLRRMRLMGLWKTGLRAYVHTRIRGSRLWHKLTRKLLRRKPCVVLVQEGVFPMRAADPVAWEARSLLEAGFDVRILCWGTGPKDLLQPAERGLLGRRVSLSLDQSLQERDRKIVEKWGPQVVADLAGEFRDRPDLLDKAFTLALSAKALGAGYLHGIGATTSSQVAYAAGRLTGIPYGVAISGNDLAVLASHPSRNRPTLRNAAVVLADCDRTAQLLGKAAKVGLENIQTKPPAVYWEPQGGDQASNGRLHAAVSSTMPGEEMMLLADAVRVAVDRGANLRIDMHGSRDSRDALDLLRLRVQELDIQDRFTIRQDDDTRAFDKVLGQSSVLLATSPSNAEMEDSGLPPDVLAAMAAGVPVVASRGSALENVVEDGREGILIGTDDPEDLASALEQLAESPELRRELGDRARARFLAEYAPAVSTANFSRLLSQLLGR